MKKKQNIRYNPLGHSDLEQMAELIIDAFPEHVKSPDGTVRIPTPDEVKARLDADRQDLELQSQRVMELFGKGNLKKIRNH